ncbi:MAG: hypothetical protein WCG10_04090 [Chlamydiota bacterium]
MKYLKLLVNSILLFTLPSLIAAPQPHMSELRMYQQEIKKSVQKGIKNYQIFSYDDVLNLLEELENGDLEAKCSIQELENINHFIAFLAKQGASAYEIANDTLDDDIQALLSLDESSYQYAYFLDGELRLVPAVSYDREDVVLCKGMIKKTWEKTKKFVKEHKTAIIVGAVVVVVVTVVVCVVLGTAGAAAAAGAAGATMAGAAEDEQPNNASRVQSAAETDPESMIESDSSASETVFEEEIIPFLQQDTQLEVQIEAAFQEFPELQATIDEHVALLKEMTQEDSGVTLIYPMAPQEISFAEKARDVGALVAHEALDAIAEFTLCIPQFMEDIRAVGAAVLPSPSDAQSDNMLFQGTPVKNHEKFIATAHEKIDEIFSTNYAEGYAADAQVNSLKSDFEIGIIPPPGMLFKGQNLTRVRDLIKAGQQTAVIAEELGLTHREIIQLKQAGSLEKTVASTFESIVSDAAKLESYERCKKAEAFIKPYRGQYLSEQQIREILYKAGVNAFNRPIGIPGSYRIKFTDKGGGIKYIHPKDEGTYVRIMPGQPHSPFPRQREPYVNHRINGRSVDKFGNVVPNSSPEAHIPIYEFIYRE